MQLTMGSTLFQNIIFAETASAYSTVPQYCWMQNLKKKTFDRLYRISHIIFSVIGVSVGSYSRTCQAGWYSCFFLVARLMFLSMIT